MAVDMFLEIEGVKGESKDSKHKDKIDILSWSWGATNQGGAHHGGGAGAGKVNVQDVSIVKLLDLSTASLLESVSRGKHFAKAKITVRKAGENPLEYYILSLENVYCTSYAISGSEHGDLLTEQLTLTFKKFDAKYVVQDDKGKASGGNNFAYNISENKAA